MPSSTRAPSSPGEGAPPTPQATLEAQRDIVGLCRDRSLHTDQPFFANAYYGMAGVLKRYAGLPEDFPLFGVIPHGIYLDAAFVWQSEIDAAVPAVLGYPDYRTPVYEAATDKLVVPSASPYVYLVELLRGSAAGGRKGTIFFPVHSTHLVTAEDDGDRLASALLDIDERFRPITVCVYWRDVELGRHLPYRRRGFRVVSAGHIYDPGFLYRFHHLCSQHTYASGSSVGSHVFYSVASGCSYVHLPQIGEVPPFGLEGRRTAEEDGVRVERVALPGEVPDVRNVFLTMNPDVKEQSFAADYFLGAGHRLAPRRLAELLEELRRRDRFGFVLKRGDGSRHWVPPGPIRRNRFAGAAYRSLKQALGVHRDQRHT